jgi:hypothetical protein
MRSCPLLSSNEVASSYDYRNGEFFSFLVIAIAIASDVPIVSLIASCDCASLMSDRGDASRSPIVRVKRRLTLFLDELVALLTLSAVAPLPDNFNKMLKIGLDQRDDISSFPVSCKHTSRSIQ